MVTPEIVRLEFPLLVNVMPSELLRPTFTLPKLKLLGLAVSCAVGVAPIPDKEIVAGELVALLATETLPLTLPGALGAKATFSVAVCPGVNVVLAATPLVL
jgi:hypothetical protein